MERELVLFKRKIGMEKEGKNELKKIKGCMQLRKISVCGVMIVKAMK